MTVAITRVPPVSFDDCRLSTKWLPQIRPDPALENRDPTRPANIPGFLDPNPTRPDDYP